MKPDKLVGIEFNNWKVAEYLYSKKDNYQKVYKCECLVCGNTQAITRNSIINNRVVKCDKCGDLYDNLTGRIIKNWNVLKIHDYDNTGKQKIYEVKCIICNNIQYVKRKNLIGKHIAECDICKQNEFDKYIGQRFGKYIVIKHDPRPENSNRYLCQCDCGNTTNVKLVDLLSGKSTCCLNCVNFIDIKDQRFDRLVAIKPKYIKNGSYYWECKCDCGVIKDIDGASLRAGRIKSCGCLKEEMIKNNTTHGLSESRLYNIHYHMIDRCYNFNNNAYYNYGGRGITVCDEWKNDFLSFYNWAINNGYQDDLTIERIDNNKGYNPSNCRWCTMYDQSRNKRNNRYVNYNGDDIVLSDISRAYNIPGTSLRRYLEKGYSIEEILEGKPIHPIRYLNRNFEGEM